VHACRRIPTMTTNRVTDALAVSGCGIMRSVQIFPEQVDPATRSGAEKALFRRLELIEDPRWSYALHSLNLSEHAWKRVSEIDFLLVGRHGVYVLEVKGGHVACERGTWIFRDRFGRSRRKRESPFAQARSAMFSLQERLEKLLGRELVDSTTFGYGVVLPDAIFDAPSVEWSDEMVIDRSQLDRPGGVLRSLNRLAAYWRAKPGRRNRTLDDADTTSYLSVLRPDYEVVPTLKRVAAAAELEFATLTARQYGGLDAHRRNDRIIYEGGAGTGKTLLAAELSRRHARVGDKVLFTCQSPVIAGYVASQPGLADVEVIPLDRLDNADGPYDVLIVDEAQDVINVDNLTTLDTLLKDGLQDGRWMFFLDSNNQRGLVGTFDPEAMEYLRLARPAEYLLRDNCRNTATIARSVTRTTGADVGVSVAGTGPAVEFRYAADRAEAAVQVAAELDRLAKEDVPANQIMLISTVDLRESIFTALPARWRQRVAGLDVLSWDSRPQSRLGFARLQEFKGLESPFVILGDVAGGDGDRSALYVGMTRARIGLLVVLPESDRPTIDSPGG
jgi:hypothetical protein